MNDHITATTYPAKYAEIVGEHRLVGWGDYPTLRDSVHTRVFGYMVRAATPVVREFHGDLLIDADTMRSHLDDVLGVPENGAASFLYCVRHSGTNFGPFTVHSFESLVYDAALYSFKVEVRDRGDWFLTITLVDARPDRPE